MSTINAAEKASSCRQPGIAASFSIEYIEDLGDLSPAAWISIPGRPDTGQPPLVAVHGIHRDARGQAAAFAAPAAALGRVVIAPAFDGKRHRNYQQPIRDPRSDKALLALLEQLEAAGIANTRRFDLFGYSGGAQFAHRFAMLYPHRIKRLTVCSAGWYTFADDSPYPYGLGPPRKPCAAFGPHVPAALARFLQIPIRICVGSLDNLADENMRRGRRIDQQQGADRLSRARNWAASLRAAGRSIGVETDVGLAVFPGVGHDFNACIRLGGLADTVLPGGTTGTAAHDADPPNEIQEKEQCHDQG